MTDSLTDFFRGVAGGAATGAMFGPVGAGAGAVVGAVANLADAVGLTPHLFGPAAEATTAAVAAAVTHVTGTDDPTGQAAVLERDPAATLALRLELAKLAAAAAAAADQARLDTLRAGLADVAGARAQTASLVAQHSVLAWGAPVISAIVILSYGLVSLVSIWLITAHSPLPDGTIAVLSVVLGAAASMATAVVSFWVGSSASSQNKSDTIARIAGAPAAPDAR